MTLPRAALFAFVLASFLTSGCLVRRTIKEGDNVVAKGYVVKPLPPVVAQ
jgi:hypothetical protein